MVNSRRASTEVRTYAALRAHIPALDTDEAIRQWFADKDLFAFEYDRYKEATKDFPQKGCGRFSQVSARLELGECNGAATYSDRRANTDNWTKADYAARLLYNVTASNLQAGGILHGQRLRPEEAPRKIWAGIQLRSFQDSRSRPNRTTNFAEIARSTSSPAAAADANSPANPPVNPNPVNEHGGQLRICWRNPPTVVGNIGRKYIKTFTISNVAEIDTLDALLRIIQNGRDMHRFDHIRTVIGTVKWPRWSWNMESLRAVCLNNNNPETMFVDTDFSLHNEGMTLKHQYADEEEEEEEEAEAMDLETGISSKKSTKINYGLRLSRSQICCAIATLKAAGRLTITSKGSNDISEEKRFQITFDVCHFQADA